MNAKQQARLENLMARANDAKNRSAETKAHDALVAYMDRLMDHEGVPVDAIMAVVHPA